MKMTLLLLLASVSLFAASPVAGTWSGTLDNGSDVLRLSLNITEDAGKLTAYVVNLENNQRIPVANVKLEDNALELAITAQNGVYKGTVAGDNIKGQWVQGPNALPLNFKREAAGTGAAAATITAADRDFAVAYLEKTRKEFLDSIRGLSAAQWNYKPASGGWSVAECAEHITSAEDLIFGSVTQRLLKSPVDPKAARAGRDKDEKIIATLTNRSQKAKAPEVLVPSGKYPTPETVISAFGEKRDRSVAFIKTSNEDLRGKITQNPLFGTIDAYEYILYMAAHSSRHTAQLLEVKAESGFPK